MPITPTRAVLVAMLLLVVGVAWYVDGRGRWRDAVSDRLLYGVPWGTVVTIAIIVAFYLFVQGGLRRWDDPVVFAFVTWSYFYPTGLISAGLAHAGPDHLLSNVTATLVFGTIAEYAWSHYPRPGRSGSDEGPEGPTSRGAGGPLTRPWVRAFVAFPTALLAAAFLTATFSFGPGLGFSGAVYALVGFSVVVLPIGTVVAVVVSSTVGLLIDALVRPVVRETVQVGPPVPPEWAGIGFQAHLLGFLIGTLVAVALLSRRGRRPSFQAVTFGVFLVGSVQALWLLVWVENVDEYVLYRGIGVTMLLALTLVIAGAASSSDRRVLPPVGEFDRVPSRRTLAVVWLALVIVGFLVGLGGVIVGGEAIALSVGILSVLATVLAVPALLPLLPDRVFPTPVSRRHAAVTCLAVVTVLVAIVSVPVGLTVVEDDAMPDAGAVTADDYAVTYVENATSGRTWVVDVGDEGEFEAENVSGVVVVSDERELWTVGVDDEILAFEGEANVTVGGVGWRETVRVERTGWEVLGNDTVYAVDLSLDNDDEVIRAFASDPARATAELEGRTVELAPTDDGFELVVRADGEIVDTGPVPGTDESTTVGDLSFSTVDDGDATRIVWEAGDTRLQIAERETYP